MAYIVNNAGLWRQTDNQRPWYGKALSLLPDCRNFSVIELGSGAGEFARLIEPRVKKITCVDLSAVYVKKLKQAGFKIIRLSYYTSMLFPLLAAERLWSRIMPRKNRGYNVSLPAPWVNSMLGGIMSIERAALLHFNLPVGSALFAVGQRPAAGNF